jgi:hypothetical protein
MEQTVLRVNECGDFATFHFKNILFNRAWIYISGIIDTNGLLNFISINL